jgi:hypothetical protein
MNGEKYMDIRNINTYSYITSGTSIEDIKKNLKGNIFILIIVKFINLILGYFTTLNNNLGSFLLFLLIIVISFSLYFGASGKEKLFNLFIIIILIIGFNLLYFFYKKLDGFFKFLVSFTYLNIFLFLVCFIYVICGAIYQLTPLLTFGLLLLILLFAMNGNILLDLSKAFSLSLLCATLTILIVFMFVYLANMDYAKGFLILSLLLLYIILFFVHLIYYHGFLSSMSFLKWFNLPIVNLRKSPLYIFCEGILFEPFYKIFDFLKNRSVIKDWHKTYDLKEGIKDM